MTHVLIVDDDTHILDVISLALDKAGMQYSLALNGQEALECFDPKKHDFVILDVGMPETDGLEVCREIRKSSDVPILFLSARDEEIDRILGLEIGGDDYVTKPFSPRELVARIGVILKRSTQLTLEVPKTNTVMRHGLLEMDEGHRSALFDTTPIEMTAIEFNILASFLKRPRMAYTRDQLLNAAWPPNIHISDRTIDSHIRNLRAKLAKVGCSNAVETVHGIGFRLGPCQ